MNNNTETGNIANTMLAAGAKCTNLNEAHGLEGFGRGSVGRPTSWCAGLINFIVQF